MPGATAAEPAAPGPAAVEDPEELARLAEASIRRAARSVAEERYWEAIQLLETTVPRLEGPIKQAGRILLARAYSKNPNWVKQGEELLQTVIREDPQNVDAHFHLAAIYRAGGLKSRAQAMLRRVMEMEPDHAEARMQLEELGLETPPPSSEPGLLKKLWRRK
jgi:cytochrome c-type biogenesis protein CcmH/NrfG